ncbi:MAG: serine hydrolase domain-containing protein [Actinomycetota bacterium]
MGALDSMAGWEGGRAGAAVFPDGSIERFGDTRRPFELASITKLYSAMATLVAHEEGTLDLDTPIGDAGHTAADLLAHSGGVAPDERRWMAPPSTRRIYSTAAYEILADALAEAAGMPFAHYAKEAVTAPLDLPTMRLDGSPGAGAIGSVEDLIGLSAAWRAPLLVDGSTLDRATSPHRADLAGVVPGFGRYEPNPWGLGPEIRGDKQPHWTSPVNHPRTFGHFGRTGTMLWIDPVADTTVIALSDQGFGPWATTAWPVLSSEVLAVARRG